MGLVAHIVSWLVRRRMEEDGELVIERVKNRLTPDYDASESVGYRCVAVCGVGGGGARKPAAHSLTVPATDLNQRSAPATDQ